MNKIPQSYSLSSRTVLIIKRLAANNKMTKSAVIELLAAHYDHVIPPEKAVKPTLIEMPIGVPNE